MSTTTTTITAELRARAQQSRQDLKAVDAGCKDAAAKLRGAIDAGDLRLIQSARRIAELQLRDASHLVAFTDFTISRLREVEDAAEGDSPDLREAAKLVAEQTAVSAAAAKMFQAGKALLAAADAKAEALAKGQDEADRQWAKGDAWIRKQCAERRDAAKAMAALYARAEKARDARDAKALAALQKEAQGAAKFALTLSQLRETVAKIIAGVDRAQAGAALRQQIDADLKAWAALLRGAEADEMQLGMDRADLLAMAVEARDARKAAKLLGLGSGELGKLEKALALDGAALEKALDAIGRAQQPAQAGREMLAALRRAKLA